MKILVCGDVHGDKYHFAYLFDIAAQHDCRLIFQVGDFGYMPHDAKGVDFLASVSYTATQKNIPVFFIDGNHENFDELWAVTTDPLFDDGFVEKLPNLFYVPRGTVWNWEGKRFAGLGGAHSLDRGWRLHEEEKLGQPRTFWWPQETIKVEDVEKLEENLSIIGNAIDILFSHDRPELGTVTNNWHPFFKGYNFATDVNQQYLQRAVDAAQPKILIHGHLHHPYHSQMFRPTYVTDIYGLHCNGNKELSWVILNTDDLSIYDEWNLE